MGAGEILAMRLGYVGELGWELHLPAGQLAGLYASLAEAGGSFPLSHFGLYAQESLRLEKCYRSWKAELSSDHSPLAASLDRYVCLDKRTAFIGQEALRREAAAGVRERLVALLVGARDADAPPGSVVCRGGEYVGLVSSGGYGYRIAHSIALAYVRADLAKPGTALEVEILGERVAAVVAREPLYDPQNLRLKS
jgi:dimethylglycine dehydrogenase